MMMKNREKIALLSIGLMLNTVTFSDPSAPPPPPNVFAMVEASQQLSTNMQLQTLEDEVDASNAKNSLEQMDYSNEIQQINQVIAEKDKQKSSNKASTSIDIGLVMDVAMIAVSAILIVDPADLKPALLSLMIAKPNTLYIVGINDDTLEKTMADPSQFQMLKTLLKKAASTYTPHVYLSGPVTPDHVRNLMRLVMQEHVVYEPANTSLEQLVSAVQDVVAPNERIYISTATIPDTTTETPQLDDAILRVLSRINFVTVNGDYVHIRPEKHHLHVEFFEGKNNHRVLEKALDVSGFTPEEVVDLVRGLIKDYRQAGKLSHKTPPSKTLEKMDAPHPVLENHALARR